MMWFPERAAVGRKHVLPEDTIMADTSTDRIGLWKWFLATLAVLVVLTLARGPVALRADKPADERPGYAIGYTAHRTDLPGGYCPNRVAGRAFVVNGDGSGTRQLGKELTDKPNQ